MTIVISAKHASIIGVAAFAVGAFISSPDMRAYAANTVFSADIVDGQVKTADLASNAVTAPKIAAGAVGSSEIAANSVGASELVGVTKLIFAECTINAFNSLPPGNAVLQNCTVNGVATDDNVIATKNAGNGCFKIVTAQASQSNNVFIIWRNDCGTNQSLGVGIVSVIVFDK